MTTLGIVTLELDVAYDDSLEQALFELMDGLDLTCNVRQPNGPGGGWPVIAFHGDRVSIDRLVRERYSPDDQEHASYILGED